MNIDLTEYRKAYYQKNKERFRENGERYKQTHKEELKKYSREYNAERRKNPKVKEQRKRYSRESLLAYYGLTEKEYQEILEEQDNGCAICGRPPSVGRSLDIDHEHQAKDKTHSPESRRKRLRGLLCHRCNRALGLFGNNLNDLLVASDNFRTYMERYFTRRMIDIFGYDEAKRRIENAIIYLEKFEAKSPNSLVTTPAHEYPLPQSKSKSRKPRKPVPTSPD